MCIASSFPAPFLFSPCYCGIWWDFGNHVGCYIVKVKSKRCSSILWQNERTGSSLVSLLLTIFCSQENPYNVITLETIFRSTAKSSSRNSIGHIMTTECIILKRLNINPALHPNISLYILLTVLYTFPKVLTRRICLIIKSFIGDHFLYSRDLNV